MSRYKIMLGLGIGYALIDRSDLEWNIDIGPAYQRTRYESTGAGESEADKQATLTFGSRFKWDITRRIDCTVVYSVQYPAKGEGVAIDHAVSTLSIELTKMFDLGFSFTRDRIGSLKMDENGVQPQPDDFRMVVSLGVDF